MNQAGDKDWFTGTAFADFADRLSALSPAGPVPFVQTGSEIADARRAGSALFRYAVAARAGDDATALRLQEEVQRLVPEVVAAGQQGGPVTALSDARRTLGDLKSEQDSLRRELEAMEKRLQQRSEGGSP
jgi:hypothetical protein